MNIKKLIINFSLISFIAFNVKAGCGDILNAIDFMRITSHRDVKKIDEEKEISQAWKDYVHQALKDLKVPDADQYIICKDNNGLGAMNDKDKIMAIIAPKDLENIGITNSDEQKNVLKYIIYHEASHAKNKDSYTNDKYRKRNEIIILLSTVTALTSSAYKINKYMNNTDKYRMISLPKKYIIASIGGLIAGNFAFISSSIASAGSQVYVNYKKEFEADRIACETLLKKNNVQVVEGALTLFSSKAKKSLDDEIMKNKMVYLSTIIKNNNDESWLCDTCTGFRFKVFKDKDYNLSLDYNKITEANRIPLNFWEQINYPWKNWQFYHPRDVDRYFAVKNALDNYKNDIKQD